MKGWTSKSLAVTFSWVLSSDGWITGKDNQQHAAAAIVTICFLSSHFVVRNVSSKWSTMPLSHESSSTLHLSAGSVGMLSTWFRKEGCFGIVTCWVVEPSVGMGRQPQPGQCNCHSCAMGCAGTRQNCFRCGVPQQGGICGQIPPRETHHLCQQNNQGLPINPTNRVLRGFNGGTGQSPPKVVPTGPLPSSNQGLADPPLVLPILQSLGCLKKFWKLCVQGLQLKKLPRKFLGKMSFRCFEPKSMSLLSK